MNSPILHTVHMLLATENTTTETLTTIFGSKLLWVAVTALFVVPGLYVYGRDMLWYWLRFIKEPVRYYYQLLPTGREVPPESGHASVGNGMVALLKNRTQVDVINRFSNDQRQCWIVVTTNRKSDPTVLQSAVKSFASGVGCTHQECDELPEVPEGFVRRETKRLDWVGKRGRSMKEVNRPAAELTRKLQQAGDRSVTILSLRSTQIGFFNWPSRMYQQWLRSLISARVERVSAVAESHPHLSDTIFIARHVVYAPEESGATILAEQVLAEIPGYEWNVESIKQTKDTPPVNGTRIKGTCIAGVLALTGLYITNTTGIIPLGTYLIITAIWFLTGLTATRNRPEQYEPFPFMARFDPTRVWHETFTAATNTQLNAMMVKGKQFDAADTGAKETGGQQTKLAGEPWPSWAFPITSTELTIIGQPAPLNAEDTTAAGPVQIMPTLKARRNDGIRLGYDIEQQPVCLPNNDRQYGIVIFGDPGSGKTNAMYGMLAGDLLACDDGASRTPIWVDTKGDAYAPYRDICSAMMKKRKAEVIRIGTPKTKHRLILTPDPNRTPADQANEMLAALKFVYPADRIQGRSEDILRSVLTLVACITPEMGAEIGLCEPGRTINPFHAAWIMLEGDQTADAATNIFEWLVDRSGEAERQEAERIEQLREQNMAPQLPPGPTTEKTETHPDNDYAFFEETDEDGITYNPKAYVNNALTPLGKAVTAFQRFVVKKANDKENWYQAPRSVLAGIKDAETLWEHTYSTATEPATTRSFTVKDLITSHAPVFIDMRAIADQSNVDTDRIAAYLTWKIWDTAQQTCTDWQKQGRSWSIYSDELSDLAGKGSGNDVIAAMLDKGRSFGAQPVFGTQRPKQLPERTQQSLFAMGTIIVLTSRQQELAATLAKQLSPDEDTTSPNRIKASTVTLLPRGIGMCRTTVEGQPTPVFTLQIPAPDANTNTAYYRPNK